MMRKREQYNICEDLLNIPANITIGQLLNISKISKDELRVSKIMKILLMLLILL